MKEEKLHLSAHTDGVHLWEPTPSPLIQRCGRGCCKVMRQWRNGAWVQVSPPAKPKPATIDVQQPGFWT